MSGNRTVSISLNVYIFFGLIFIFIALLLEHYIDLEHVSFAFGQTNSERYYLLIFIQAISITMGLSAIIKSALHQYNELYNQDDE